MKIFFQRLADLFEQWIEKWSWNTPVVTPPLPQPPVIVINNRERLYDRAFKNIGTDVTPDDVIPDEYDCADTVNKIHEEEFGDQIGGGASTTKLYQAIQKRADFQKVELPLPGDIVISPTGYGNGRLSNGHVGICAKNEVIMSNNSYTGKLDTAYTLATWKIRYVDTGGFPMDYFRKL